MNRLQVTPLLVVFLFIFSFTACKKTAVDQSAPDAVASTTVYETEAVQSSPGNDYKLAVMEWPYGNYSFQYNSKGLCSSIQVAGIGNFQQEFNNAGRLLKSRYYLDGNLEATIVFTYANNGLANKETRYQGNSNIKTDEIFITRNNQGLITKFESVMNDYVINAQYSPQGNNTSWQLFVSNVLAYDVQLQYRQPIKNHFRAVKGIDYGFPFINGFMFQSKFTPASEKFTIYDEFGDAYVLHDYDPDQCFTIPGFQNYPSSSDWFDRIAQGWVMHNFYYDNAGQSARASNEQQVSPYTDLLVKPVGGSIKSKLLASRDALIKKIKDSD